MPPLFRRYAPLAVVLAAQLVIILVAPSVVPGTSAVGAGGSQGGSTALTGPGATGPGATVPGAPGAAVPGAAGPGAAAGAAGSAGSAGAAAAALAGDTTHCVKGREFDPAFGYWAPPCVPGTPGAAFSNNGGAITSGVSGDTIELVDYVTNYGAEINAILQAEGLLYTYDNAKTLDAAFQNFLNKHFVFYGRKVHIDAYAGQCNYRDDQCILPELDRVVQTYHPYAVLWNTSVCTECFAELARNHVVAVGGIGFSDNFAKANSPYFYTSSESSTRIVEGFAQWWCNQMSSVNVPSRKVKYAGHQNPAQDFNGKPRVLGIITPNPPDNRDVVNNVLVPELRRQCGENVTHFYFYDQNINTAAQHVAAGIAAMDTPNNPATDVLCICDVVAPAFLYEGEQDNNYYPENVLADVQGMGYDLDGQSYGPSSQLACPNPSKGCEFDNAFGLVDIGPQQPQNNNEGIRIYHDGGGQGNSPATAITTWIYAQLWTMLGALLENAGPHLDAATMQAKAPGLGSVGGGSSGQPLLQFTAGDWSWRQDAALVYWDNKRKSSYNGANGAYVYVGNRINLGQYPVMPGGPPIPTGRT